MKIVTHDMFPGTCEEAFRFYERVLGGKIGRMQTYGEAPGAQHFEPEWHPKIVHGSITIGTFVLAGADVRPAGYHKPNGFFLLLGIAGAANAKRVFEALAENGDVSMYPQETFWSPAFAVLVDRFGIPWEINGE